MRNMSYAFGFLTQNLSLGFTYLEALGDSL